MARPPINPFWIEQIYTICTNYPKIKPPQVRQKLEQNVASKKTVLRPGIGEVPSLRTCRTYLGRFKNELSEEEKGKYRWFDWPDVCEENHMPWEASQSILDLLFFKNDRGMQPPTLAEFQWFWRVMQGRPNIKVEDGVQAALLLSELSQSRTPSPGAKKTIMWALAYNAKKSPEYLTRYDEALRAGKIPPSEGASVSSQMLGQMFASVPYGRKGYSPTQ